MRRILLFAALLLAFSQGRAQKQCATMEMDSALRQKYPQMGTLNDFEQRLQRKMVEMKAQMANQRNTAEVLVIPVVVHIVHNGEGVGQGRNLSEAQVKSQIEVVNEDFRRKRGSRGFNDDPRGADIEIEFCLAATNPQGQRMAEAGIDRINGNRNNWTRADIEGSLKPSTIWDPNKYCNMWVLDFAPGQSGGGELLGYAQFPSGSSLPGIDGGSASTDGIVVTYKSFGSIDKGTFPLQSTYNLGRTTVHELGHWLGLRHIWGDASCGNDFVDDTPTQASESTGCQKGRVSCGGSNMVENYMDYSNDACFNIFTNGQKARMRAVMDLSPRRVSLKNSNLCGIIIAGRPRADFLTENRTVLLGGQVSFTDLSTNFPNRWQWTFEGGDPATSSDQNPVVVYKTAGKFKVTLVSSNSLGTSEAEAKTAYVEVLNVGLCAEQTNFRGTPTLIRQPAGTGYVAGNNSQNVRAVSEFFANPLGYTNLSGATLRFGLAKAAKGRESESTVKITAWNARGFQNGPGAVLETKEVPLRQIIDDVANGRTTAITFDRTLPLFGLPYHIGIQIDNTTLGDSIALITTRDGESTIASAWELSSGNEWDRYIIRTGLNVAHAITAKVGMKPSVQVSASALFIDPLQPVTLLARGAGILSWTPAAGLSNSMGAQVTATPARTTTYTVRGSGADVCTDSASVTINVRNITVLATEPPTETEAFSVSPNPASDLVTVVWANAERGQVQTQILNLVGQTVLKSTQTKQTDTHQQTLDLGRLPVGSYMIELRLGGQSVRKRILKF